MAIETLVGRVSRHLADPYSHHGRIATGFLWVSFFVLVGKIAGAAKEMAIAWRYGVSETVDAYVFVFNLFNWPVAVWLSVLTAVVVPIAARVRNDNSAALPRFRGELLGLTLLVSVVLGVLGLLAVPAMLRAGWAGLSGGALEKALYLATPLSLLVPLGVVISLFSAMMLSRARHRNTLFESIPALVLLIVLLLPPAWVPEPLLWGTMAGFALHLVALAASLHRQGELQAPRFAFRTLAWPGFWGGIGFMAIGHTVMSFTGIIDQFFAASLGPGAVSTLSYANRIVALILGLGAMATSRATLPVFSKAHAEGVANLNSLAMRWARWMFIAGFAVFIIGWVLAPVIVKLLFERGAFSAEDTTAVTGVMRYAILQIPFYFAGRVFYSLLSSQALYFSIGPAVAVCVLVKISANYLLVPRFGLGGLQLATTLMYAGFFSVLWVIVRKGNYGSA